MKNYSKEDLVRKIEKLNPNIEVEINNGVIHFNESVNLKKLSLPRGFYIDPYGNLTNRYHKRNFTDYVQYQVKIPQKILV